jgi:NAD(P)-dependent dehydrogenase (short-subunit alcohol dehydrogenase family)
VSCAIVTGAGSGIGAASAIHLSQMGFDLVLVGRDFNKLKKTAKNLKGTHVILPCDLTVPEGVAELAQELSHLSTHGIQSPITALINNAGAFIRNQFEDTKETDWEWMWQVNMMSAVRMAQITLPFLKQEGGVIVNVASTLGLRGTPGTCAYSAVKAAMINWTQTLARELAPFKIRVNSISPGIVDTPIHAFHGTQSKQALEDRQFANQLHPLGRMGSPDEIAHAIGYFCSQNAQWTTGANLVVDGGINLV